MLLRRSFASLSAAVHPSRFTRIQLPHSCNRLFSLVAAPATAAKLLDGRAIAQQILSEISAAVKPHSQSPPGLAVILVGSRADSMRYVSHKQKAAQSVGFKSHFSHFPDDVTQAEVMAKIDEWNNSTHINGILVQLPLPAHLDQARILSSISVHKDVDGFHPLNFGCLALRRAGEFAPWENRSATATPSTSNKPLPSFSWTNVPCTPKACLELLDRHQIPIAHRTVVVLGRSNIVGLPLTLMLMHRRATVINITRDCPNVAALCRTADILIAAIGQPKFVQGDWIKPGAVVIDVGINFVSSANEKSTSSESPVTGDSTSAPSRMVGDVDFEAARAHASLITPVPGGVGPMTVAMLLHNTLLNFQTTNAARLTTTSTQL